jgi:hypothetical protein
VAPALDPDQQPVIAREPDRRGDVVGRGRLEDQGWELGDHAVPGQDGLVPTLLARSEQPALDPRVQVLPLLQSEADGSAVKSGEVDGASSGHDGASSEPVGCPRPGPPVYSKRQ